MAKQIAPTTKNSLPIARPPSIHNGPASEYATHMKLQTKSRDEADAHAEYATHKAARDVNINDPIPNGVSYGTSREVETAGIEMRGAGAATKGRMSRGPMA